MRQLLRVSHTSHKCSYPDPACRKIDHARQISAARLTRKEDAARAAPPEFRARAATPMSIVPDDRRVETDRAFRQWRAARSKQEADRQLVRLWELCRPEIARALKDLAARESPGKPSAESWLKRRGLTFEEVAIAAYPAVEAVARRYDPGHESGASFPTFAMGFIKGEIARLAGDWPPLAGSTETAGGVEDQPQEEPHQEEEARDFGDRLVALAREDRKSEIIEKVYRTARYPDEFSSGQLRRFADRIDQEFAEELKHDPKLQTLRMSLGVMATRAEDYEGRMLSVRPLWHLLLVREARRAQGMPAESYSPAVLAREFGRPSSKTLKKWLAECDELGITAENWTPEQLARIIWSRRGPKFRDAKQLPLSRPSE